MSEKRETASEMRLDEALAEYLQNCDSGGIPNRDEFLGRHPEVREQLDELLGAADWIEQLAGPTLGELATAEGPALGDVAGDQVPADDEGGQEPMRYQVNDEDTLPLSTPARAPSGLLDAVLGNSTDSFHADPSATLNEFKPIDQLGQFDEEGLDLTDSGQLSQPALPCDFGDYRLEKLLGRGGMGVVYYARQKSLDRPVAVKMIRSGALASEEEVGRFYAEAKSAGRLSHSNIVTVYQCGEHAGHHYFSMDYVSGTDLAKLISEGALEPKQAAKIVRDVARAIEYAHQNNVLHRDLKPANVLVDENNEVRITDFGLAKLTDHDRGLTASGAALGTPSYMSPEQASGKLEEQAATTDVYAMGAVLFAAIAGRPPFKATVAVQTIMQVIHKPAPRLRSVVDGRIDEDIETIVDVCLQKAADRRYQTAGALADDLDRYLSGAPIQARPISQLRRVWCWLMGVPIFAALLDDRHEQASVAHRWVQRGLVTSAMLIFTAAMLMMLPDSVWKSKSMPRQVTVTGGAEGGEYANLAGAICEVLNDELSCKATSLKTQGSDDNAERLLKGEADLALLQADSISSPQVMVLAPLYYEAVHVLVRKSANLRSLEDLRGHKVVVGSEKAGSRSIAKMLMTHIGVKMEEIEIVEEDWHELLLPATAEELSAYAAKQEKAVTPESVLIEDATDLDFDGQVVADAAIVVAKLGSPQLHRLLAAGIFQLIAIPDASGFALEEPTLRHINVRPMHYDGVALPESGVPTVATTAFLATRDEASDVLVRSLLEEIFSPEFVDTTGIFPPEKAAHWRGLPWHPAAREFFMVYRGVTLP